MFFLHFYIHSCWQVMLQVASGCENSVDLAQRVPRVGFWEEGNITEYLSKVLKLGNYVDIV